MQMLIINEGGERGLKPKGKSILKIIYQTVLTNPGEDTGQNNKSGAQQHRTAAVPGCIVQTWVH